MYESAKQRECTYALEANMSSLQTRTKPFATDTHKRACERGPARELPCAPIALLARCFYLVGVQG